MIVAGKMLGKKKPLFAEWSVPIPPEMQAGEGTTLRQVISLIVREQVAAFRQRQADQLFLRVLTSQEIETGAERGKVTAGLSDVTPQNVDEEAAIGTALEAFEDGIYLVVLDEQEHRQLDTQVFLKPDSRITFIRLTLLAGG